MTSRSPMHGGWHYRGPVGSVTLLVAITLGAIAKERGTPPRNRPRVSR